MTAFLPIVEVPQSHPPPYVHTPRKVRREGSPATPRAHAQGPLLQGFILLLIALASIAGHARLSTCATEETHPDNDVPVGRPRPQAWRLLSQFLQEPLTNLLAL